MRSLKVLLTALFASALALPAQQPAQHRPPAVPLITNDRSFSVYGQSTHCCTRPTLV